MKCCQSTNSKEFENPPHGKQQRLQNYQIAEPVSVCKGKNSVEFKHYNQKVGPLG